MSSSLDQLLEMTVTPQYISDQPFIESIVLQAESRSYQSWFRKGKTTALIQHVNHKQYDSVLVASPRRSFSHSVHQRLNKECEFITFECYDSVKEKGITNPYIICQSESFHRLHCETYDLVVLDEIESFLYQLTSIQTHKERQKANLDAFQTIMKNSPHNLLMDAFISN